MPLIDPDKVQRPIFVLSERYDATVGPWHRHERAQFIHASTGVLTVTTTTGLWVVPPQRAVWILPGELHRVATTEGFHLRTLYAQPGAAPVPERCCVVNTDPLLDALLVEASAFGADYPLDGPEARLMQVIADRLPRLDVVHSYLPRPRDARLLRLTQQLEDHPADSSTLHRLAPQCGMSARTAARLFQAETGLTFAQWRQQLRMLMAIAGLSTGHSVARVATDVGYTDTSSFIAVFKDAFGNTPARYFRAR